MFNLFKSQPLVDDNTLEWSLTTFAWALQFFDQQDFFSRSRLVQPSNEFFPGRVSSVDEKAANIFQHTLNHAGLSHWPFSLQPIQALQIDPQCQLTPAAQASLMTIERNSCDNSVLNKITSDQPLQVFYNPQQTLKPEDMAASFAHVIAQHLIIQSQQLPPGGMEYFNEASELLACMMGFGVLLSNSAFTYRGGCGSCYNPQANRQPALTEIDNVLLLALYCRLKNIDNKQAMQSLKKHLHKPYQQACKQLKQQEQVIKNLKLKH